MAKKLWPYFSFKLPVNSMVQRKKTGNSFIGGQGSMMHMESKGCPMWSDPIEELL